MNPEIVIVHAPYHQPAHFDALCAVLGDTGTRYVPDLELLSLGDAIQTIQMVVDSCPEPPVVVSHSFGGAVAGALTGVAAHVFISAFVLEEGETAMSVLEPATQADPVGAARFTDALRMSEDGRLLSIDPSAAGALFFGDCEPAQARRSIELLRPALAANFTTTPAGAHWRGVPSVFVHTRNDPAWPSGLQESFAARCGRAVALDSSHSPYISRPRDIAEIIIAATA